jgi:UDP-N-acetylglucosamine--N-acetylmuramyl-(pentapeptide) pyrophosphoryl-undecaprenol N-acetylglucosamine transferase
MEMEKVPQAGFEIKGLWISGFQRKFSLNNLLFPIKLISSLIKAGKILKKYKPHLVVGTGGFASGPLLQVAARKGIPCLIQEQNSYAGITNKILGRKVSKICVAYDGMERFFPKEKIVKTGNPVRGDLIRASQGREAAYSYFELDKDKTTLLVLGGSLGARRINQLIAEKLHYFSGMGLQIIWQCGRLYYDSYNALGSEYIKVHEFLNRMDYAYAAADIIISRAGASTVSELCLVGKPVILIPSPHVAEDHQTRNAEALVLKDAAVMIAEDDLETGFESTFSELHGSGNRRRQLGHNIRELALPEATTRIVDEIEKLLP